MSSIQYPVPLTHNRDYSVDYFCRLAGRSYDPSISWLTDGLAWWNHWGSLRFRFRFRCRRRLASLVFQESLDFRRWRRLCGCGCGWRGVIRFNWYIWGPGGAGSKRFESIWTGRRWRGTSSAVPSEYRKYNRSVIQICDIKNPNLLHFEFKKFLK